MSESQVQRFDVVGMTCEHCVRAVGEEVGEVPGVASVDVSLDDGVVLVHGAGVDADAVRRAIAEAGYATR